METHGGSNVDGVRKCQDADGLAAPLFGAGKALDGASLVACAQDLGSKRCGDDVLCPTNTRLSYLAV